MPEQTTPPSNEDWMQKRWRPAMGWMYMLTCITDFILFPAFWSILQVMTKQTMTQWQPLTLQGAGFFHLAMGAVLGIAAWGRTQEKVAGAASNSTLTIPNGPLTTPTTTAYTGGVPLSSNRPVIPNPINNPTLTKSAGPSFGPPPAL
jgi:hypothetical protein